MDGSEDGFSSQIMTFSTLTRFIPSVFISLIFIQLFLGFGNAPIFGDADTAWHIAAGDFIRAHHSIPSDDPWSFTATGQRWYNLSWLYDIGISIVFQYGGLSAIYALTVVVFAGCLGFMANICVERGASRFVTYLLTLLILVTVYDFAFARPGMCSVILTITFYYLLHRYRSSDCLRYLLVLPFLMVLWVNLHGGFIMAFPLIGLFLMEALWQHDHKRVKAYATVIILCLIASFINPYGLTVYYGAYRSISSPFLKAFISEWRPAAIGRDRTVSAVLVVVLSAFSFSDKRIPLIDRMLTVMMMFMALNGIRHIVFAALLIMPALSMRLSSLFAPTKAGQYVQAMGLHISNDMQRKDVRLMVSAMALGALAIVCVPIPFIDNLPYSPKRFPTADVPVKEAAFIAEHYPYLRFINNYGQGGYLIYLWRGKVKLFIDGRASSLYSESLLNDYKEFTESHGYGNRAEAIVAQYHIDGALVSNKDNAAALWAWNPLWTSVYHGDVATVYIRKKL